MKTCITPIDEGFDFPSQNLRKFGGKLSVRPSKKNTHAMLEKLRFIIDANQSASQENLIQNAQPSHSRLGKLPSAHCGK